MSDQTEAVEYDSYKLGVKRARKPYTLTKERERWNDDEHNRFLTALKLFNRDWKKIEAYVETKTVVQIRSHAQKYFQKAIKSGDSETIPPARPKRKPTTFCSSPTSKAQSQCPTGTDTSTQVHEPEPSVATVNDSDVPQKRTASWCTHHQPSSVNNTISSTTSDATDMDEEKFDMPTNSMSMDQKLARTLRLDRPQLSAAIAYFSSLFDPDSAYANHVRLLSYLKDDNQDTVLFMAQHLAPDLDVRGSLLCT